MKRYLIPVLAALTLSACEDYTEKHFGALDELWTPTEVNNYSFTLSADDYAKVASATANVAMAEENGLSEQLKQVATTGAFSNSIDPADYLPAIFANLVGSKFYAATAGSTITIKYNMEVPTMESLAEALTQVTTATLSSGKYVLVPHGTNQVLTSNHEDGKYGYLNAVTAERINASTLKTDGISTEAYFSVSKSGEDSYYLSNSLGNYLYLKGTYASFNFIEDLGDLDEDAGPEWNITKNEDGSYCIHNTYNSKNLYWSQSHTSVGAYDEQTEDYIPLDIYRQASNVSVPSTEIEEQEIVFTLDENGEWGTKGAYLDMALVGGAASSDANEIFDLTGWSIETIGGIGDLTYVWRLDATYGLRASAYKNPTYYPTDAWAISPRMNMKKAVEPIFQFEQAQKYAGTPVTDYLRVYVSTDYSERGQLSTATWDDVTELVEGVWPDGSNWDFSPMSIDLSKYAGQPDVRVAFRYISTDAVAATWEVKNILCKEKEESAE